jgi:hypothetical protein
MNAASEGDFSYATDGGILIRVPRISNVPERGDAPNNMGASILQNLDATSRCLPVAKPAGEAMKVRPKRRAAATAIVHTVPAATSAASAKGAAKLLTTRLSKICASSAAICGYAHCRMCNGS